MANVQKCNPTSYDLVLLSSQHFPLLCIATFCHVHQTAKSIHFRREGCPPNTYRAVHTPPLTLKHHQSKTPSSKAQLARERRGQNIYLPPSHHALLLYLLTSSSPNASGAQSAGHRFPMLWVAVVVYIQTNPSGGILI